MLKITKSENGIFRIEDTNSLFVRYYHMMMDRFERDIFTALLFGYFLFWFLDSFVKLRQKIKNIFLVSRFEW